MSILHTNEYGWIISHSDYISKVYENTQRDGNSVKKYVLKNDLFDIVHPYQTHESQALTDGSTTTKSLSKKRKAEKISNLDPMAEKIEQDLKALLETAKSLNFYYFDKDIPTHCSKNANARQTSEYCTNVSLVVKKVGNANGGNTSLNALYQKYLDFEILIPSNCRFLCGDVRTVMCDMIDDSFDLVVMDPPWWNKYIRRHKALKTESSYDMLYNEEIASLPLGRMLSPGALVAVWCTNCSNHETSIKEEMFPSWGVQYTSTWYWIKLTKSGEPICRFSKTNGKQPFERIIFGIKEAAANQIKPPKDKLVVSIPSALHSHKPPLNDLLQPYLSIGAPRCLEVFARYLLPNTLSIGKEPLRWQHLSLYSELEAHNSVSSENSATTAIT